MQRYVVERTFSDGLRTPPGGRRAVPGCRGIAGNDLPGDRREKQIRSKNLLQPWTLMWAAPQCDANQHVRGLIRICVV
jgi:hypothetical protein